MPTKYGMPTLYEAVPYPGAPRYFKRDYTEGLNAPLIIYGYSCRSTYPEDLEVEDGAWRARSSFPSMCFSTAEPDGEYGFTPLSQAQEISVEELENALADLGVEWAERPIKDPADYLERRIAALRNEFEGRLTDDQMDELVQADLFKQIRAVLGEAVQRGNVIHLGGDRYRSRGGVNWTVQDIAESVFPQAFRNAVRIYSRWEDAAMHQLQMLEFTSSYMGHDYMIEFEKQMNSQHPEPARVPEGFLHEVQLVTLGNAEPCYISADVCELIDHARHSFELEEIRASDPFVPSGFCLLAQPIMLSDAPWIEEMPGRSRDGLTPIRAIAWTSIHSEDYSLGSFWISFYNHFDDDPGHHEEFDLPPDAMVKAINPMLVGHMFQWTWGDRPVSDRINSVLVPGENEEHTRMRAIEQGQIIQTLWRLGQQLVPAKRRTPRPMRREAKRKNIKLEDVNVVILRRERFVNDGVESDRAINVSFMVRGHWHTYHTREGAIQKWVKPYLKGEGLPFKDTERAWEFRR